MKYRRNYYEYNAYKTLILKDKFQVCFYKIIFVHLIIFKTRHQLEYETYVWMKMAKLSSSYTYQYIIRPDIDGYYIIVYTVGISIFPLYSTKFLTYIGYTVIIGFITVYTRRRFRLIVISGIYINDLRTLIFTRRGHTLVTIRWHRN